MLTSYVVRTSDSLRVLSVQGSLEDAETARLEMLADGDISADSIEAVEVGQEEIPELVAQIKEAYKLEDIRQIELLEDLLYELDIEV